MPNPTAVWLNIETGSANPSTGNHEYTIWYTDNDNDSKGSSVYANSEDEVFALVGTEVTLESNTRDSDEIWVVNDSGHQIMGRGYKVKFTVPSADSGFKLTRYQQEGAVPVVINTISNLKGGMSAYTYDDFEIVR